MGVEQRKQRELEERYHDLRKEIERRGGSHGEINPDVLSLEAKVEVLEYVLRYDDQINGKR
jgi:hypothetical protein